SYQMKFAYLPYHVYQGIIDADDMGTYRDRDEVVLCERRPVFGDIPFVSKAIRKEGRHYGNFFIIGLYRELDARDFEVAEHIGNIVATALYGDSNYLEASSLYSSHFIIDVIEGNLSSVSLMTDQLHALNWSYVGDYALALITLREEDAAIANHIKLLVNGAGDDVNSFTYQGNIVAVFNRFTSQAERVCIRLAGLARDFNTTVMLSNPFSKFDHIRAAYLQTEFLSNYAQKNSVITGLLQFSNYFLDYISYCAQETAPMHSFVERLVDYDNAHGTEYCLTLYTWLLLERNTVRTAEVLYIHRNTLKNRLVNIDKILGLDLDDPSVRMQLITDLHLVCAKADDGGFPLRELDVPTAAKG
ncbi:MAG: helix-turn-helix domain-containing protein, partial [Eggerthellaceae bacterium]|nr:helix-turn-helix domain-containing protein [Eggerthellaceae bacterium]